MNYTRQFRKYAKRNRTLFCENGTHMGHLDVAQYFVLPDGGSFVGDSAVQALEKIELIRLPYPNIVLEYCASPLESGYEDGYETFPWEYSDRRIVLLKEHEEEIAIANIFDYRGKREWSGTPWFTVRKKEFLNMGNGLRFEVGVIKDDPFLAKCMRIFKDRETVKQWFGGVQRDINGEITIAARFIAALSCRNVTTEDVRSSGNIGNKRSCIPYNTYKRLVLSGSSNKKYCGASVADRASPREHLRRGHIRRIQSGELIWINSTVVNAGIGGRVDKVYDARAI